MAMHMRRSVQVATLGFGRSSGDLALVVFSLAATALAVLINAPALVRTPLALALVCFVPGYALTVALFPTGESSLTPELGGSGNGSGISLLDRVVLSVGLSLSLVVITGLIIDVLPFALTAQAILGALIAVTIGLVGVALVRRRDAPVAQRYSPFEPSTGRRGGRTDSRTLTVLRIALALSLVFAGVALVQSGGATAESGVTELYVVSSAEAAGADANAYPGNLTAGDQRSIELAVGNHEGRNVEYTLVGQRQVVDNGSAGLVVSEREEIHRETISLQAGATASINTTIGPPDPGRYRVAYLLYAGEPPTDPTIDNAAEEVHLWIDVTSTAGTDGQ